MSSNVRPHNNVNGTLKIALSALVAFVLSLAFAMLAAKSIAQGYAAVGRYSALTLTRAESPLAFYLSVSSLCALAVAMLLGGLVFVSTRGARRDKLLSHLNSTVFGVRSSIRWLLAAALLSLGALAVTALVNRT